MYLTPMYTARKNVAQHISVSVQCMPGFLGVGVFGLPYHRLYSLCQSGLIGFVFYGRGTSRDLLRPFPAPCCWAELCGI